MHNLFEHVSKGSPISIRVGVVYTNGFNSQALRLIARKGYGLLFANKVLKSQLDSFRTPFSGKGTTSRQKHKRARINPWWDFSQVSATRFRSLFCGLITTRHQEIFSKKFPGVLVNYCKHYKQKILPLSWQDFLF